MLLVACPVDVTGFGHDTDTNKYTIFTRDEKSADDTRCNECVCLYSHDGHDGHDGYDGYDGHDVYAVGLS